MADEDLVVIFDGAALEARLLNTILKDTGLLCRVEQDEDNQPPTARLLVPREYADRAAAALEQARKDMGGAADTTIMDA